MEQILLATICACGAAILSGAGMAAREQGDRFIAWILFAFSAIPWTFAALGLISILISWG